VIFFFWGGGKLVDEMRVDEKALIQSKYIYIYIYIYTYCDLI